MLRCAEVVVLRLLLQVGANLQFELKSFYVKSTENFRCWKKQSEQTEILNWKALRASRLDGWNSAELSEMFRRIKNGPEGSKLGFESFANEVTRAVKASSLRKSRRHKILSSLTRARHRKWSQPFIFCTNYAFFWT